MPATSNPNFSQEYWLDVWQRSILPLDVLAASGLKDFELLLNEAAEKVPLGELVDIMDVGWICAYLATPYARRITGGTVFVDGGANIRA
jgi:enoyl-[acyl-carrier protein] reductase I